MIKVSPSISKVNARILMAASFLTFMPLLASAPPAHADWRNQIGTFRIGIATQNGEPYNARALEGFRVQVQRALAMPVEIFQARNASSLIDAAASSRIEYAILSSLGFVTLDLTCDCVSPLVAPTSEEGASMVRSVLFVNSKKVSSLDELTGKRLAIGGESSLSSTIIPMAQFSLNGNPLEKADIELVEAETIEQAVDFLASGTIDGFFGWDQVVQGSDKVFESSLSKKLENNPELSAKAMWFSEPIRFGPHVIHNSVPDEAATILVEMLQKLHDQEPLAYQTISPDLSGGFQPVAAQDYISAFSLIRGIASNVRAESAEPSISAPQ